MTSTKHNLERAILAALFSFFFFSVSDGLRKLLALDYALVDILFWQGIFAIFVLLMLSPLMGGWRGMFVRTKLSWHTIRAVLIAINTTLAIITVSHIPLMDAYTIFFLTPFVTTVMAMFFFGERFGIYRWMAIIGGFIGAFVAFRPGFADLHWAYWCACAGVFTFSIATLIARHIGRDNGILSFGIWPVVVLLIAIMAYQHGVIPPSHDATFLMICAVCGGCYGSALVLISYSYTLAPASVVAPYQYVQIVFALGFGYFMFGDVPDIFKIVGASIIIGSGVFLFIRERIVKQRLATIEVSNPQ
jgi:drug/metabolite transporter (DMT)-like permease